MVDRSVMLQNLDDLMIFPLEEWLYRPADIMLYNKSLKMWCKRCNVISRNYCPISVLSVAKVTTGKEAVTYQLAAPI